MKPFYKFIIFFLFVFFSKNTFAQGREIPNLSILLTDTVEVGDSCVLSYPFGLSFGSLILPEMRLACDSIYMFLKQNPSIRIAIIVHSDFRPLPMTNDTLTMRRASYLMQYILGYGDIDSERIIAIGMADRQPRIVTKEIHKQYKFLPVGQVLSEEFCRTLIDNRQNYEKTMSLNSRTVVKIIEK